MENKKSLEKVASEFQRVKKKKKCQNENMRGTQILCWILCRVLCRNEELFIP